jgi:hypothetical protein
MYQQLWGYKVEENYVGVREQKGLNTAVLDHDNLSSHTYFLEKWFILI